jgi:transposase-like protein
MEFEPTDPAAPVAAFLEHYRAQRFRDGVRCPHCDHARIHRHGSFSQRRRYRCLACGRTFSDLTGTALAYSKKPALWPQYARCAAHSLSVRNTARIVGLSVSTAFRWRHATLREFVDRDDTILSGSIEFVDLWFAYSEKGSRGRKRPGSVGASQFAARTGGKASHSRWNGTSVRVVIACDRHEEVLSDAFVTSRVSTFHLLQSFRERIRTPSVILVAQGPLGPFGSFARKIEAAFRDCRTSDRAAGGSREDVAIANSNGRRFRTWLMRFYGVATKYLSNYLGWHRLLERRRPPPRELAALGWPFEQPGTV